MVKLEPQLYCEVVCVSGLCEVENLGVSCLLMFAFNGPIARIALSQPLYDTDIIYDNSKAKYDRWRRKTYPYSEQLFHEPQSDLDFSWKISTYDVVCGMLSSTNTHHFLYTWYFVRMPWCSPSLFDSRNIIGSATMWQTHGAKLLPSSF